MHKKRLLPLTIALVISGHVYAQEAPDTREVVEEVTVTGVRQAELNAREEERQKNIFSSVISQDDAGMFADQNVAESLQRLPGITLQKSEGEGKFVSVRGLGPGFVSVNMNGSELASSSSDTRAFALDAVPSDLLSSVEVFKSLTPDMDLNSIAGTVNVKTVNAFDRKKDSLRVSAQVAEQSYDGEKSPKVSLQGTNLLLDNTLGLGYSLSYEKRGTTVFQNVHHASEDPTYRQQQTKNMTTPVGPVILTPWQFEFREEQAERTRKAASVDLTWRPTDDSEYYIRYSYTSLRDLDIALREYYRVDTALNTISDGETIYIDPQNNTFGVVDAELQHQFFIQDGEASTDAFNIGGKNIFNENWTLDYQFSKSVGKFEKPDGRRVQFRIQDLPMLAQAGKDYFQAEIVSADVLAQLANVPLSELQRYTGMYEYDFTSARQENMTYDNLFIEDSFREDTLNQYSVNIKRDFDSGVLNYIKFGGSIKDRERDRNKDRWSIVPGASPSGCAGDTECLIYRNATLGMFETYTPAHPDMQHEFITRSSAEALLAVTQKIAKFTDPNLNGQESRKEDYFLTEDTKAAYLMAEWQTSENSTLIAGARYETTDFSSSGYFAIRNDRFADPDNAEMSNLDIAVPLQGIEKSYSDVLPSIHYRWNIDDSLLFRSSIWTSFTRPSFDQARAYGELVGRVNLCNPVTNVCTDNPATNGGSYVDGVIIDSSTNEPFYLGNNNTLKIGNPNQRAMTAVNYDTSLSWYGENGDHWQIAAFYKDIKDFIVAVNGASLSINDLPMALPFDQISGFVIPQDLEFDRVNFSTNGDKAKVYGVELSYSKYFDNGFLIQTNATIMESKANVGDTLRAGTIQLPDQADNTFNLTLGWEKDDISLRLIGNHRSKILNRIGACTSADIAADAAQDYPTNCRDWSDVYQDASTTLDFKATYEFNKSLKFNFDLTNLTDEKDLYYFKGNEFSNGKILFLSEDYGRTALIGVSYKLF